MDKKKPLAPTGPKQTAQLHAVEGRRGVVGFCYANRWHYSRTFPTRDAAIRAALAAGFVQVMDEGVIVARVATKEG